MIKVYVNVRDRRKANGINVKVKEFTTFKGVKEWVLSINNRVGSSIVYVNNYEDAYIIRRIDINEL